MSQLEGYSIGGVLHVVINNQIGFTTSPKEARSSRYATDVAKMLQMPIFHVNGDDPEAVAQVVGLAMDFRRTFKRDAVIDMYGYRRWGHNEGDEPTFTQPRLYQAIKKHRPVRDLYLEKLLREKIIDAGEANRLVAQRRADLENELARARSTSAVPTPQSFGSFWAGYSGGLGNGSGTGPYCGRSENGSRRSWKLRRASLKIFSHTQRSNAESSCVKKWPVEHGPSTGPPQRLWRLRV